MQLRPYQKICQDATIDFIHNSTGNGIVVAECSAGKSLLMADIAEHLLACKQRPLILADRSKLIKQNAAKFSPNTQVGIVSAGLKENDYIAPVVVAGIQTIYNKADKLGKVDWILADECEAIGNNFQSDSRYHQLLRQYPHARIIGYSATPYSLAEGAIQWGVGIHEITYQQLLDAGFCTPLSNKICDAPDLSSMGIVAKEYNLGELGKLMSDEGLIKRTVHKIATYLTSQNRKKTLIFCSSVDHALTVGFALQQYEFNVDVVHSKMSEERRQAVYNDFEHGKTDILLNVEILTKGADFPCIDCVICLRPTESMRLFFQMVGRGIRLYPGKTECLLLDFSGNLAKFGTLGNPIWKYQGSTKKKTGKAQKACPSCEQAINIGTSQCPLCNYIFLKDEIERELKHDAEADLETDLTKPKSVERYYTVNLVLYSKHKSKAGNESLRVEYHAGKFSCSEYVPFANPAFWAKRKVIDFIKPRSDKMPETIDEALELCETWKKPKIIKVRPQVNNPKYWEMMGIEEWA